MVPIACLKDPHLTCLRQHDVNPSLPLAVRLDHRVHLEWISRSSRLDSLRVSYVVPRSARLLYTGAAWFIGAQPRRRSLSPIHLSRTARRAAWCRAVRLM